MIKHMAVALGMSLLIAGAAMAQAPAPADAPAAQQTPAAPTSPIELAPASQPAPPVEAPQASATADAPPASTGACIAAAGELGQAAEGKPLSDDQADKLDNLFTQMETLCDGQQFAEAMGIAKDIRSVLQTN